MSEDRSLDDFAPDGDPDDPSEDTDADGLSEHADADDPGAGAVEPATATSTWHTDGADCDQCGARVERRWRDGDALVCAGCAPW